MTELTVTVSSHNFALVRITPRGRAAAESFAKRNVQYGFARGPNNKYIYMPLKVFAAATNDRSEFRFHINQFKEFQEHLKVHSLSGDMVEYIYIPVPEPVKVEFKILPKWSDRDYQTPVIEYLVSNEAPLLKFVNLQTGKGKAQPLNAKIKVPGGWSTMGEMFVGKKIIAKDGSTTEVIGVHPKGKLQMYKVTFADGRSTECCADHLWRVYYINTSVHLRWRTVDTLEVMRLISMPNPRVYVELIDPEDSVDVDLPIDPYVLGLILGDGHIGDTVLNITKNDEFIFDEIRKVLPKTLKLSLHNTVNHCLTYGIIRTGYFPDKNEYLEKLREMGLGKKLSHEKFIPKEYLNGSYKQRLSILQGLLDTDGCCGVDSSVSFSSSSEQLAKDVQYLVRSIGGIATIGQKQSRYILDGKHVICRISYRMTVRVKNPSTLFRLPRKKENTNDDNQYSLNLKLKILSIVPTTTEEAQCISIAHLDRLYITDDFIVTHNSYCTMRAMEVLQYRTLVIVKPMYIEKWQEDILRTYDIDPQDILIVRGGAQLMKLLVMAEDKELTAKIIILSNKTLQLWITLYEKFKEGTLDLGYACTPDLLCEWIGAGVRLIDEVHQDFHFNFKLDCYTNVKHSISLSATLVSDDDFVNKVYAIAYPPAMQYKGPAYDKYISAKAIIYNVKYPDQIHCKDPATKNYSHHLFEQSILRNKTLTAGYLNLIDTCIKGSYLVNHKKGEKLIIFCASIAMCTLVKEHFEKMYRQFDVRRYVESDPYENLMEADIRVTTLQSAGTAVDIPNLTTTILTTAVSSSQSNIQGLGRLRKLEGTTPEFLYFACESIPKHIDYHERKKAILKDMVLHYKAIFIPGTI